MLNVSPSAGCATAPATSVAVRLPERDVHGPVVARHLGELAGAVERVDDPHPLGLEPRLVVLALFREHRVVRPVGREQLHQQLVGGLVAGVLELTALETLAADLEQPLPRDRGEPLGQDVVVGTGRAAPVVVVRRHLVTLATIRRGQRLKRCWVRSSPSATRLSTASAASTTRRSSLRSAEE